MKFNENNGEDYYDSFSSGRKRDGELFKKIQDVIDLFVKNGGDFKTAEGRDLLSIIITEEAEEHFSDVSE